MPAINFPNSPELDEIHSENNFSWKWNGYAWIALGSTVGTPSGGIAYGNGSSYLFNSPGNSGEILISDGNNAPYWGIPSSNSISFISSIWS